MKCILFRLLAVLSLLLPAAPVLADLNAHEVRIVESTRARAKEMHALLEKWVRLNTGSFHVRGLQRFAEGFLRDPLTQLGFRVEVQPGKEIDYPGRGRLATGPLVIARRSANSDAPRFMLSGHYDTVFEPDSSFQRFEVDPGSPDRARGPGVSDMKGGLVVMLHALRALAESGDLHRISWTIVLNGDEEIGSLGSRETIEAEARKASYGFVFESSREQGTMVKSRRGLGQFFLTVRGVAAHAGSAHDEGRSAVLEMAHKIVAIEALTDYRRGVTLNTGTVHGGQKRNIVPDRAEAWIDLRFDEPLLGESVRESLERISARAYVEGTESEIWGTLHRPPKLATEPVSRLLGAHAAVTRDLGLSAPQPIHAGGGTDGSLMGASGLPTLDSMGVRGGAAHTDREYVLLDSLPERAAIAAILFRRLLYENRGGGRVSRPSPAVIAGSRLVESS